MPGAYLCYNIPFSRLCRGREPAPAAALTGATAAGPVRGEMQACAAAAPDGMLPEPSYGAYDPAAADPASEGEGEDSDGEEPGAGVGPPAAGGRKRKRPPGSSGGSRKRGGAGGTRVLHRWSADEHARLGVLIGKWGTDRNWALIAEGMHGRTGKQCRERWLNHMREGIIKCAARGGGGGEARAGARARATARRRRARANAAARRASLTRAPASPAVRGNWLTDEEFHLALCHTLVGNQARRRARARLWRMLRRMGARGARPRRAPARAPAARAAPLTRARPAAPPPQWSQHCCRLRGRTENSIKNYWCARAHMRAPAALRSPGCRCCRCCHRRRAPAHPRPRPSHLRPPACVQERDAALQAGRQAPRLPVGLHRQGARRGGRRPRRATRAFANTVSGGGGARVRASREPQRRAWGKAGARGAALRA